MSNNIDRNEASSSSDDEYIDNFRSNIQLPYVNLSNIRKQHQVNSSRSNLVKAGKKLKPTKNVRFPDSYTPRQSVLSTNSSATNNSSDSELLLDETTADPNLPSFKLNANKIQPSHLLEGDSGNEGQEVYPDLYNSPANLGQSDSSDDEDDHLSRTSKDSVRPKSLLYGETDITDQIRNSNSLSSSPSKDSVNEKSGGLRGILRRMSLADKAYPENPNRINDYNQPSTSDTFLGRVLNFSNNSGLSGGGLAPGASRYSREKHDDEEQQVGLDNNDTDAIELKKMDFGSLNKEAQNLISVHVPGAAKMMMNEGSSYEQEYGNISHDSSTVPLMKEKDDNGNEIVQKQNHENKNKELFYAPNPDYYLRGEVNEDQDKFLLDEDVEGDYIAPPKQVHAGVLSSLLKLYQNPQESKSSSSFASKGTFSASTLADEQDHSIYSETLYGSKHTSTMDFTKWKNGLKKGPKKIANKLQTGKKKTEHSRESSNTTEDEMGEFDEKISNDLPSNLPSFQNARPKAPKRIGSSSNVPAKFSKKLKNHKKATAKQLRITVHIADILQRQRFIIRMCKALMLFGAPTHRLEEYMIMTSRVLEIDGQFVYFPGCMIVSFGDAATRTSEVHLVRCAQGLNLSKLSDTHRIYKGVIHDLIGVEEAASKLEELLKKKNQYAPWLCVFFYGLGSASVCPFAFGGGWYDIPIAFGVGLCVGYLQFFVSSMSNLYSSVFEISSSIVVSFIARAIGSINQGNTFCFSAIAQGSLALILPGYIILCGSLELQSRNIVAGSVRMFYAIIYSLFLGFGITLGAALYGWVDKNSTSETTCQASRKIDAKYRILFVPLFSLSLALINQARWRQLPVMILISGTGYIGTYFAGKHFSQVTEFTACIGAFIVGILGNMYSRLWKGMAVSAMLPAIFVQVPSGIASQGSLLSGVQSADRITKSNDTETTSSPNSSTSSLSFGATMVEVSIGISVGLFAAALVVYPFGKKRTGLFTL